METDLRRSPRVPFIASAHVTELDTEVRLSARTGDLSSNGCYVDMINPLPQGTTLKVVIEHGQQIFTAMAGVIYSQCPLGMGLEFRDVDPVSQQKLRQWLTADVESITS
jgi:hypothetical protein